MNHYTAEINQLKKALVENNSQLLAMEENIIRETDRHVELEDSLIAWQDKYERLHESHKRVQKVNQSLEDKLLKLVDRNTNERAQLSSDVATLSVRLAQANYNIGTLQREIVSIAILRCAAVVWLQPLIYIEFFGKSQIESNRNATKLT